MASFIEQTLAEINARKDATRRRVRQSRSVGGSAPMGPYRGERVGMQSGRDQRLYKAFRDVPFTAIRPIAVRFASKPLKAAAIPARGRGGEFTKALRRRDCIGECNDRWELEQKALRRAMPGHVKANLPPRAVVLDDHEALAALQRPNDIAGAWENAFSVVASIMLTGHAMLLWDDDSPTAGLDGRETPGVYYIPMHWATPDHSAGALQRWRISPPGSSWSGTVKAGEFVYFRMPNPADPFQPYSPTMASSRTINTAEKISEANYAALENMIAPKYAFSIGRPQGPDGSQSRPVLRRKQRQRIGQRLKSYLQGVAKNGEIFLLDGLIDDVKELGAKPRELDFSEGEELASRRTMEAYGVSPIVAGYSESANRAGSVVATEIFDNNVINPLLALSGNAFTQALSPKYSTDEYTLIFYHEESRAEDPEAKQRRAKIFPGAMSLEEKRRYVRTGEVQWADSDTAGIDAERSEGERARRVEDTARSRSRRR